MRIFILALLLLMCGRVFAADPVYTYTPTKFHISASSFKAPYTSSTVFYNDVQTWCSAYVASIYGTGGGAVCIGGQQVDAANRLQSSWYYNYSGDGKTWSGNQNSTAAAYCDAGWSGPALYRTSVYECRQIQTDPCSDKNPLIRKFYYTNGGPYLAPDNYAGCIIAASSMLVCRTDSTGTYCMWQVNRTGAPYKGPITPSTNGEAPVETPEVKTDTQTKSPPISNPAGDPKTCNNCPPCPTGTVQGGVDSSGIPICIGTGTNPPDPVATPTTTTTPTVTKTNADGSTVATSISTQSNADGSTTTTTTTTTTAANGAVTVQKGSQTSLTPGGVAGKTDTPDVDKNNLCKQNPTLTICLNSTVSGTCGAVTCTGDAIQCATLRATAQMQCKQQADSDAIAALPATGVGTALMAGNDPMAAQIQNQIKGDSADMSKSTLDQTGFIGGGACIPDKTFTVSGKSITVSFSSLCENIQPLRYVIMSCAFLVAYLMVSRSVISGS